MFFIDRKLNIFKDNPIVSLPVFKQSHLVSDTEFTKFLKLLVDCIGVYLPDLIPDYLVVFTYDELSPSFHPLHNTLKAFGYSIELANQDSLIEIINTIQDIFEENVDCNQPSRKVSKAFKEMKEQGYFDHALADLNVEPECITLSKDKNTDSYVVSLKPPTIDIPLLFFYGFADLFKIWGKDYHEMLLESNLTQQRCLKLRDSHGRDTPMKEYNYVDGMLYEFRYTTREAMYRFPPIQKSLDAQTSIFEVDTKKINVKTWDIATALGFDQLEDVMSNFSHFLKRLPEKALPYHATDVFATWDLHKKQQEFYDLILANFEVPSIEVSDTTGSNVSKFIVECIKNELRVNGDKDAEKILKSIIKLSGLDNLEEIPLNDFGCQPFLTVGGLLFSRMAKHKFVQGKLSDCDLKSCYASFMSKMNVYLGEPVTLTCKYDKYKLTLKDALQLIENQKAPHDAWFIRISGKLEKAINTLVMSDLKFKPKSVKQQQLYEVNDNRKSIGNFNAYKTTKRAAQSTILTKEIKFGIITKSTIEALKKLPTEWYEEYLNLKCDVICFYPGELIADNMSDYYQILASLPEHDRVEKFDIKHGAKSIDSQKYKNNATLAFPIGKYWEVLKEKRGEFKKAKNPVQEVFKLFQNSGYGVLACLYLPSNNLMASNQITAGARSGAWLMTNALNGFGSITDGTSYAWDNLPLGLKFHDVLVSNPQYVEHFDPLIESNIMIDGNFKYQGWIDENLKKHLMSFYQVGEDDYNLNQFDYELKTEKFLTVKGQEFFANNSKEIAELKNQLGIGWGKYLEKNGYTFETPLFTKFYNNNGGNYCKGMDGGNILIEGEEYNIVDNEPFVKARSFQGGDSELINWYTDAISNGYKEPLIYSENKLIKFGDGNKIAIAMLESGSEKIAHPMGFDTVAYKLMKLITRSQFLFQNEAQLRNFETNEMTLTELSKELGLNQKIFWDKLTFEDITPYGVQMREGVDYFPYAKTHPIGVGFELLSLTKSVGGDINKIRCKIVDLIDNGCKNFNAALAITRNLKNGVTLKYLFAAVIIAKKNAEDDLRLLLENSADESTIVSVTTENIKRLYELMKTCEDD
jgi:hypothetical protein